MLLLNLPALRCCPSPDVVVSVVVVVVIVVQSPELSIGGTGGSTPI